MVLEENNTPRRAAQTESAPTPRAELIMRMVKNMRLLTQQSPLIKRPTKTTMGAGGGTPQHDAEYISSDATRNTSMRRGAGIHIHH
jgi:hypothetical protein